MSLKELTLGHGPQSGSSKIPRMPEANWTTPLTDSQTNQFDCVSLSLSSGLDKLSGLKQLRTLDVSRLAHKIGVLELEWMREHWPVLRVIIGLQDRVGVLLPHKWHGKDIQDVREWIARHPCGIGSAYPARP